jgi:hypothetical protein
MPRKLIGAVALLAPVLALLAGPAVAQNISFSPFSAQQKRPLTHDEIEKQKAADAAYKAAVAKIPEKKNANDPWGSVREAPPSATAPAKPKPQ